MIPFSQESAFTPIEIQTHLNYRNNIESTPNVGYNQSIIKTKSLATSPSKKRIRGKSLDPSNPLASNQIDDHYFPFSQDNSVLSQFSQDFSERLGQMNFQSSQDYSNNGVVFNIHQVEETKLSNDGFSIPYLPPARSKVSAITSTKSLYSNIVGSAFQENEKQVDLPPPIRNEFLRYPNNLNNSSDYHKPQSKLWISAFKERPRFLTDFEEIRTLGEGNFSTVYCMKHRLDGTLYAVKRIKEKIVTQNQGHLLTREVCALAALRGCDYIIKYYNSWVDDHSLYIQTELCALGNLEHLISMSPPLSSVMGNKTATSFDSTRNRSQSFTNLSNHSCQNMEPNHLLCATPTPQISPKDTNYGIVSQATREATAWRILHSIASALSYIHQKGMVHLDIRPANIFLTLDSRKIFDSSLFDVDHHPHSSNIDYEQCSLLEYYLLTGFTPLVGYILSHDSMYGKLFPSNYAMRRKVVESCIVNQLYVLKLGDFGHCCRSDIVSHPIIPPNIVKVITSKLPLDPSCMSEASSSTTSLRALDNCSTDELLFHGASPHFKGHDIIVEGDSRYCARELIDQDHMKSLDLKKSDMFSLGATVYELCLGRPLGCADEDNSEWHQIRNGLLANELQEQFSADFVKLIRELLHPDPIQRPTAFQVLQTINRIPTISPLI